MINKLPDPPSHLSEESRQTWIDAGTNLLRAGRLNNESIEKVSDLCYWEDQRLSVLNKLRDDQVSAGRAGRSVHLKNLKAIKQEIDAIRDDLGLDHPEADRLANTPNIPDEAYQNLPPQLANCCSLPEDPDKKDILLLSLLPIVAAHLPSVLAEHANGYYLCSLNIFLVDGSGAGKQMTGKIKAFIQGEESDLKQQSSAVLQDLQEELAYPGSPSESRKKMRLTIENDTGSLLRDEARVKGIEQASSVFNKVFAAVPLVVQPGSGYLSVLMTGDRHPFRKFAMKTAPSLYSSFLLYSAPQESKWQSNRPDRSTRTLSRRLAALMADLVQIRSRLSARKEPITSELSPGQWQMIDDTFSEKMEIINELGLPAELHTANENAAIYSLKLVAIFTVLRSFDENPASLNGEYLTPQDDDVIAALWITDTCLKHAIRLHDLLPGVWDVDARGSRYLKYYSILPASFETAEALELAAKLDIPPRSAKRYLNEMLDEKKVTRVKRGVYKKIA